MLHGLLTTTGGNVEEAAAMYNSGQEGEAGTTHHDYGLDVLERMQYLQQHAPGNGAVLQPPPSADPGWFYRDLSLRSPYMTGSDVKVVQSKTGAAADGVFGPSTRAHVVNFQSHHGLSADGIVGRRRHASWVPRRTCPRSLAGRRRYDASQATGSSGGKRDRCSRRRPIRVRFSSTWRRSAGWCSPVP